MATIKEIDDNIGRLVQVESYDEIHTILIIRRERSEVYWQTTDRMGMRGLGMCHRNDIKLIKS